MSKYLGPYEPILNIAGSAIGMYVGYMIGSKAVENSNEHDEKVGTLDLLIGEHPTATKAITTMAVGKFFEKIGGLVGCIIDTSIELHKPEDIGSSADEDMAYLRATRRSQPATSSEEDKAYLAATHRSS